MQNSADALIIEELKKPYFVWFEDEWKQDNVFHWHKKGQLIYVETGYQYITVDGKTYLLPQNHCAWIPSNAIHKTNSHSEKIKLMMLFFDINSSDRFFNDINLFSAPPILREMIRYSKKWSKNLENDKNEQSFLSAIFMELPNMIHKNVSIHIKTTSDLRLKTAMEYLQANFVTIKKIDELVSLSTLSLRTFERIFKKETGVTFVKYQQMLRIIKSVELLSERQLTISEVAHRVGYKSLHVFTKSFFSILHIRPSDFIKTL